MQITRTMDRLNYARYQNVVAMPLADGKAGLFLDQGLIEDSLLWRIGRIFYGASAPAVPEVWVDEEVIFGGYPIFHYGHFLLEGLTRLWITRDYPNTPIAWLDGTGYSKSQREILDLLGVSNRPFFVQRPTGFRNIIVPTSGYVLHTYYDPRHAAFLAVFPEVPIIPGRKVWLSRTRLQQGRGMVVNQEAVENVLASAGWTISHPEEHSLRAQLHTLASAERIAGVAGSAFHSFMLMQKVRASVDIFPRFPLGPNNDYALIADVHRINQRLHYIENVEVGPGADRTKAKIQWTSIEPVLEKLL